MTKRVAVRKPRGGARPGAGGPPHEPTDENRALVRAAVAADRTPDQIASFMKISKPTLLKHYPEELKDGLTGILVKAVLIVNTALNDKSPAFQAQRVQTALTVLARRGNWSESVHLKGKLVHEHQERQQTTLARLGEAAKSGDHNSAAQAYEELLNGGGTTTH